MDTGSSRRAGGTTRRPTPRTPEHFLPHIQGLRAIAVLLVVVYHFWPGRLTGGYIGVDIFFVISGFLITGQLFRELERSGGIRLPQFYAKRARRLLPAALTVLIFCAIATLLIMPLSALSENVREIIASTFYVENWVLAFNATDYLNAENDPSLVQHYWSLSLEEQFYLMWPLLLLAAAAIGAKFFAGSAERGNRGTLGGRGPRSRPSRWTAMLTMIVLVSVASLLFSILFTASNPSQAYFVTFTRMWEFGAGAVLALVPRLRPRKAWTSNLLGYAGVLVILLCAYFYDRATPFPGYAALLPVLATAAVITAHRADRPWDAARMLSLPPARFVGDISYSLYLWHWPLIVIAPFVPGWGLSIWNRLILFVLCFVLAWLTMRFVEDPVRGWRFLRERRPRITMAYVAGAMVITTVLAGGAYFLQQPKYAAAASELQQTQNSPPECFGAASGKTDGLGALPECDNRDLVDVVIPSAGFGNADRPDHAACLVTLNDSELKSCRFGSAHPSAPRVALIGDSHAYALIDPLIRIAEERGWALTTYLKGACPWNSAPLPGHDAFTASCENWRSELKRELERGEPFNAVFTTALADRSASSTRNESIEKGYREAWGWLDAPDTPIVTVVDNPAWPDDPNKCLRASEPEQCTVSRADALLAHSPLQGAAEAAKAAGLPVTLLDFTDTYCDAQECFSVIGGANVYRDPDHLTKTFALSLRPYLDGALTAAVAR